MYNDTASLTRTGGAYFSSTSPRSEAINALGRIGSPAVPALIEALESRTESADLREFAADALEKIKDPRSFRPLVDALNDESTRVVVSAAQALGKLGDRRAVEPLIKAMKELTKKNYGGIEFVLGELGDPRAVDPLLEEVANGYGDAALAVAKIIAAARIEEPRAVNAILLMLKSRSQSARASAAEALGILKDSRAIEPLIDALKDENDAVRSYAAQSLGRITGNKKLGTDHSKWTDWWKTQKR